MGRIRVLPEAVANKIAAGEVVERPASVVKELVENAIDAGATDIAVEVRGGGTAMIRVRDNGSGMGREDALISLQRHSTSKIADASDLFAVTTYGFRGEALPSIAAVCRMELTTKERGALAGTRIAVEGGRIGEARETGAPDGTEVAVRDLFFNTPARLKFLKSPRAELSQIAAIVLCEALSTPAAGYTLTANGEELVKAPAATSPLDRIAALFGPELVKSLCPFSGGGGGIVVHGFVSAPEVTRGNRTGQYYFVNGRPVQDRILSFAVSDACEGVVPARSYPLLFLFLDIEPREVDVNVHPAKREVRFKSAARVREIVRDAIALALRTASPIGMPVADRQSRYETRETPGVFDRIPPAIPFPPVGGTGQESLPWGSGDRDAGERRGMRVLGQAHRLYVICEDESGIVIVDQHAAHERVLFEKVMAIARKGSGDVQRLLIPSMVQLSAAEYALMGDYLEIFKTLGIGVEPFGGNAVKIEHLPACLGAIDPERLLRDVAGELMEEGRTRIVRDELAALVARKVCRAAVKRRDPLTGESLQRLLDDLHRCETPHTCPHGRPTIIRMSVAELNKKFGRA
ncbi:MAG: DNA mismatch repair endonuclease MutL [Candidatus Aureabacteria bacterium]|nr:DNA mismatch repair endonuclease MutL [Candidatus Auribacterota bacterium]